MPKAQQDDSAAEGKRPAQRAAWKGSPAYLKLPARPPRPSKALLAVSLLLFVLWLAFLVGVAIIA